VDEQQSTTTRGLPALPSSPVVITVIVTIGLAVLGAFWQLSDPRSEIKRLNEDLHSNYLTIREHQEFQARIAKDISRLEAEQILQNQSLVQRSEADAIQKLRDQQINDLRSGIELLTKAFHDHEHDDRIGLKK